MCISMGTRFVVFRTHMKIWMWRSVLLIPAAVLHFTEVVRVSILVLYLSTELKGSGKSEHSCLDTQHRRRIF